jgi:hypothetical protein
MSPWSRSGLRGSQLLLPLLLSPILIQRPVPFPTSEIRETRPQPNLHSLHRIRLHRHGILLQSLTPLPPAIPTLHHPPPLPNRSRLPERRTSPPESVDTTIPLSFRASKTYPTFIPSKPRCSRWPSEASGSNESLLVHIFSILSPLVIALLFKTDENRPSIPCSTLSITIPHRYTVPACFSDFPNTHTRIISYLNLAICILHDHCFHARFSWMFLHFVLVAIF